MNSKSSATPAAPYHHGNLRNALIAEGRRALEEIGVRELSLRYLARAVGVSEAAPSRHFAGKEGMLAAIAADGFHDLATLRSEIQASDDTAMAKAYSMMRVYVEFAQRHKGLFNLMIGPRIVTRDSFPELNEIGAKSFRLFASSVEQLALEHGWPKSSLTLVTHAAWSMEHGLATLILSDRVPRSDLPVDLERMIHFSISIFLSAVAAGPAHLEEVVHLLPRSNTADPQRVRTKSSQGLTA
ncbi:TetR/AcrR family transcriptional regulator [Paraburkholderia elongata]|uniref:TetR family transcriptional regulator n=1 Tax=Paraburkholderia elongata TaxID=2675747 RepID=A0A972NKS7_9BURK|nr:TetR/AcrR family transcriptional regulator [Paraburkholderia elongata]NPT53627.1 TetR family transcriptional regulator [Paraburkholderia elongata]